MTEREALVTLINAADVLSLKDKSKIIEKLDQISDEDVRSMGVFLAKYLKAEEAELAQRQIAGEEILRIVSQ